MAHRTDVFTLTDETLTQFAEPHTIERTARIDGDRLIMESAVDRRILRGDDLPADGPRLETGMALMDWAFRIARRDIEANFHDGGMYAGANFRHTPTWVRDTSISALAGMATFYADRLEPILRGLLDDKLGEIRFEQYRGFYEDRYFSMTDHIIWVLAAEALGRVRGDGGLLRHGAPYAARTIDRMIRERFDPDTGLLAGGSCFFDGHSGYPDGMTGPLLRSSSTNLLYVIALRQLEALDGIGDGARAAWGALRRRLAEALDRELWLDDRGWYAQFQYGRRYREERFETLGNLFAVACEDVDDGRARRIVEAIAPDPYGLPTLKPWYAERIVYHAEAVWPFLTGIALWAGRRRPALRPSPAGGVDLTYLTGQLLRTGMLEGTFMELLHCRTGQGRYSPSQVWSAAAMLAVVEHGLFGMRFEADRLVFAPSVPAFLEGRTITLHGMPLRGRTVTLTLSPEGAVSVDGRPLSDNVLPLDAAVGDPSPIEVDTPADVPEPAPFRAETTAAAGLTLAADAAEIVVFPADEQIGSYRIGLRLANAAGAPRTASLACACPGLTVTPSRLDLTVQPGRTVDAAVRVGFDRPPVHFGGAELTIADAAAGLRLAMPVRRLLTLDCSWRFKPLFKERSRGYARDFHHYDAWDMLRVPMNAEFRLGPYVGVLWLARKPVIPAAWAGRDLVFYAGGMSDWDVTYFNGTEIGRTGADDDPAGDRSRRYPIAAALVKAGEVNTIAVKVWCSGVRSGIHTGPVVIAPADEIEWAIEAGRQVTVANILPEVAT